MLIEILAPPLLAALVISVNKPGEDILDILLGFPVFVLAAYMYGVPPSVAYAVLMEFWFGMGLHERCGRICTVGLSSMLGMGAGYLIQLIIPGGGMPLFPVGGLIGLLIGTYLVCRGQPVGSQK